MRKVATMVFGLSENKNTVGSGVWGRFDDILHSKTNILSLYHNDYHVQALFDFLFES